ncbi:MAG: hypothetical protein WD467_01795 [Candidatus Saccharimonadales bacterium]
MINRKLIDRLMRPQSGHVTSIYLPTHKAAVRELEEDRIRFRNLLDSAATDLIELGYKRRKVEERLRKARDFLGDDLFWQHQRQGLAVYISEQGTKDYRLPLPVPEVSITAGHYHIKPLIPLISANQIFYILQASLNRVQLYRANMEGISVINSDAIPVDIKQGLGTDDNERQLQNHVADQGGSRGDAIFHGHGGAKDLQDVDPPRFIRLIAEGVNQELRDSHAPVLFAGDDKLFSLYRGAKLKHKLVEEHLSGNFDTVKPHELHRRALELMQPRFAIDTAEVVERYHELKAKNQQLASGRLEEIVRAALAGKVERLLYRGNQQVWGEVDDQQVVSLSERRPGAVDLIDIAIAGTYAHGGEVHEANDLAGVGMAPALAILRY